MITKVYDKIGFIQCTDYRITDILKSSKGYTTGKFEDYEKIKERGWDAFQKQFIAGKCDNNWENLKPFFEANPRSYQKFYEAGIPCIVDFLMITPFEYFCGGRSPF